MKNKIEGKKNAKKIVSGKIEVEKNVAEKSALRDNVSGISPLNVKGGKIESAKIENPKGEKSVILDKILRTIKNSLSSITPYKEPFSGKEFSNKFDAIIFKTNRLESKFTKTFLSVGEIILSNKDGIFSADKIKENYVASSLPAYVLSYYKTTFPNYRIRETILKSVENDREGGGESKGVLSFKLVKV